MALAKQNIPLNFGQGVDTKTDDKQVMPGKLLVLENGVFKKTNKISKRNGYDILGKGIAGDTTSISAGSALGTFRDELNLFDGSKMYSYSKSNDKWVDKGRITSVINTSDIIIKNQAEQTNPSVATNENVTVYAWEDSRDGIRATALDQQTGTYLTADVEISSSGTMPKVVPLGRSILVFFIDGTSIKYRRLNTAEPTSFDSETDFATNLDGTDKVYDVLEVSERVFVTWNNDDGSTAISIKYIKTDFNISSEVEYSGEEASTCITLFSDAVNNVWVAYYNGSDVKWLIRDYSLENEVLGPTIAESTTNIFNVTGIITDHDNNIATLLYERQGSSIDKYRVRTNKINDAGLKNIGGSVGVFKRSVGLASKAFSYNSNYYVFLTHESDLQATYFLANLDGDIISKVSPLLGGGLLGEGYISNVGTVSDGVILFASEFKGRLVSESGTIFSRLGIKSTKVDFTDQSKFISKQLGKNTHIVGGVMQNYDGDSVSEHGFHLFPENVSISPSTSGGSVDDGVHQYVVIYEWTDNQGQVHRSAPSIPETVTNSGGDSSTNTVTIPTLRLTRKTDVNIVVYRTEASGTIFYRLNSISSPLANDTTIDSVDYDDTASDASIISNEILYTTGGVLDNIAPPSCTDVTSYKNRLIISGLEDENELWYSKERAEGEPVNFTDSFRVKVDPSGGGIGAHAVLDDKFIIFKKNQGIYFIIGDGPTDTGLDNDFTDPQEVASDVGCDNPRSVVNTPRGLMFKSNKGIYLLDRSLQVQYTGNPVEDFNDLTITGASLVPDTNQIRFTTQNGNCLVYDYLYNQWSTFTNHEAEGSIVWDNTFVFLKSDGSVYQENSSKFTDGTIPISMKLVTGWLSLAGLQAYKRVYKVLLLGEFKSYHKLIFKVGYDFNEHFTEETIVDTSTIYETTTYGEDSPYGSGSPYGGEFRLYQFRFHLGKQKVQSIRFSIEDIQTDDFGEGFDISALSLQVGVKPGLFKKQATRSFGSNSGE